MHISPPVSKDFNLEEWRSDLEIRKQLVPLIGAMNPAEKMALGLNAHYLIGGESPYQLCELRPKHGDYPADVQTGIFLITQLSPQGKAELVTDLLMDEWELGPIDDTLAPSTIIE